MVEVDAGRGDKVAGGSLPANRLKDYTLDSLSSGLDSIWTLGRLIDRNAGHLLSGKGNTGRKDHRFAGTTDTGVPAEANDLTRREFVRSAATGFAPLAIPRTAFGRDGRTPPNERLQLGLIGSGPMGWQNLKNCAGYDDVVVTAICDVWKARRDAVAAQFPNSAKAYADYRELLQRDDVDAVIIASPPHWHALHAIAACEAKKDLYLQKPMTLYPDESLAVRNAVRKHERICQVGTQVHASENFRRVVEYLRSQKLGKVSTVHTFHGIDRGREGIGRTANGKPHAGLDWNQWVGPAQMRPFNELIVKDAYSGSSFLDYSGGWTAGMAPHVIDLPYWALELDFPQTTMCSGGRYAVRDIGDVADTQEVTWQYPDMMMTWSSSLVSRFSFDLDREGAESRLGCYFHGVNGTLFADYHDLKLVPEGERLGDPKAPKQWMKPSPGHEREWLDCIKSRQQPSCNADYHAKLDVAIGLANLSYRVGRSIRFDAKTERIVGDEEAARLARPVYREPWQFPLEYC